MLLLMFLSYYKLLKNDLIKWEITPNTATIIRTGWYVFTSIFTNLSWINLVSYEWFHMKMNRTNENFLLLTINVSTYAMWLYWQLILYPPPLLRNCAAAAALSLAKWLIVFVVLLALQVCSFAKRVVNAFIEAEVTLSENLWIFLRLLFYHHFSCFRWTFIQTKTY